MEENTLEAFEMVPNVLRYGHLQYGCAHRVMIRVADAEQLIMKHGIVHYKKRFYSLLKTRKIVIYHNSELPCYCTDCKCSIMLYS